MMVSIALGIFILGIVYVIVWSIMNDKAGAIRDQTGFLRMRVPPGQEPEGGQPAARPRLARPSSRRPKAQRRRVNPPSAQPPR